MIVHRLSNFDLCKTAFLHIKSNINLTKQFHEAGSVKEEFLNGVRAKSYLINSFFGSVLKERVFITGTQHISVVCVKQSQKNLPSLDLILFRERPVNQCSIANVNVLNVTSKIFEFL